jgi:hypothetical protein
VPSTPPGAPPKSILKNTQGIRNLRNLTEVPSSEKDAKDKGGEQESTTPDSGSEANSKSEQSKELENSNEGAADMDLDEPEDDSPPQEVRDVEPPHRDMLHNEPPHHHPHMPLNDWSRDSPQRPAIRPLFGDLRSPFRNHRPDGPQQPFRRDPRFPPHRPPPHFDPYRDHQGRPFPKRLQAPFEFRHRHFPRY